MLKSRFTAAGIHLLASAAVISLCLCIIYFIWYPEPFYTVFSVFDAVKIVLSVDLVLGPFLTLVIFNTLKPRKELVRDMTIILLIQISALSWGIHITQKMRPLFIVFQGDTFYPVIKEDVNLEDLNQSVSAPAFWQQPKTVYIEPLKGEAAIQRMNDITSGVKIEGDMYQVEKYRPLTLQDDSKYRQNIIKQAMSYTFLSNSKTWQAGVEKVVKSKGGNIEDYLFYPLENDRFFRGLIAFNKKDFTYVGLVHEP